MRSSIGRAAAGILLFLAVTSVGRALELPAYVGSLEYMGERTRADTRPGASYSYRAAGLALDIDVFEYAGSVADGSEGSLVRQEYARARHAAGGVRGARLLHEGRAPLGSREELAAREAVFTERGAGSCTYLWLTASHGRLVRMRLDVAAGFEEEGRVSRSEVLAALGDALTRAPETEAAPGAQHLSVAILWDPSTPEKERGLWSIYLYTRAAQAAQESEDRVLPAGERQASFEEEVRARRVAVSAFRRLPPPQLSDYFADLDRVEAAGFLREYVWRYLRAPSWTEQPEDLRLGAFDDWRALHLRGHVAVTHGRIALRLANLTR